MVKSQWVTTVKSRVVQYMMPTAKEVDNTIAGERAINGSSGFHSELGAVERVDKTKTNFGSDIHSKFGNTELQAYTIMMQKTSQHSVGTLSTLQKQLSNYTSFFVVDWNNICFMTWVMSIFVSRPMLYFRRCLLLWSNEVIMIIIWQFCFYWWLWWHCILQYSFCRTHFGLISF